MIELDWALLSTNTVSVKYESIEWIEIVQDGVWDTIFSKWKLVIHKIWGWDNFILENAALPYDAIDEIETISREQRLHNEEDEDYEEEPHFNKSQYNMLIEALSWVVEQYMENSWYKKDDTKEKEEVIQKVKKKRGTIDIR